jgi:hypothetical protein
MLFSYNGMDAYWRQELFSISVGYGSLEHLFINETVVVDTGIMHL